MDWLKQLPKKWLLLGSSASVVILITLLVGIYLMVNKEPQVDTTMWEETSLTTTTEVATDATKEIPETMIYVDIKGAVKVPGIYQLKNQQRIWDALALAGGVSEEADTAQVLIRQQKQSYKRFQESVRKKHKKLFAFVTNKDRLKPSRN